MVRHALLVLVLVGCEAPDPKIVYVVSNGAAQSCGSSSCADVKVPCDAVVSIRVLRPTDPTAPPFTLCEPLPQNSKGDLCALGSIDLGDRPIEMPKDTFEVQILVWAREDVAIEGTNELDCGRHEVTFDAVNGFPLAQSPAPAIGGHSYYHPGDEEIRVTLGCTDLPALRRCDMDTSVEFTSTVEYFESLGVLVSASQGSQLSVGIGEPALVGADTVYSLRDLRPMTLENTPFAPVWKATFEPDFVHTACVQVLEDAAQATASVRCFDDNIPPAPTTTALSLRGDYVPKATLDQVLAALSLTQFPANGLTIGVVVDSLFNPVPDQVVLTNTPASIRYLSEDRANANGTATSKNGIFVSQDARFGTEFRVAGSAVAIGGQIQGKVTIVVIRK